MHGMSVVCRTESIAAEHISHRITSKLKATTCTYRNSVWALHLWVTASAEQAFAVAGPRCNDPRRPLIMRLMKVHRQRTGEPEPRNGIGVPKRGNSHTKIILRWASLKDVGLANHRYALGAGLGTTLLWTHPFLICSAYLDAHLALYCL
eukprot:389678-Amphidinium_carterae.1